MTGSYDLRLVLLSWGVAALASIAFIRIAGSLRRMDVSRGRHWWLAGSAVTGAGLWAAHVAALLAIPIPVDFSYSLPVAMVAAIPGWIGVGLALRLSGSGLSPGRRSWTAALALVAGIGAMHYIGLAALRIVPSLERDLPRLILPLVPGVVLVAGALSFALRSAATQPVRSPSLPGALLGVVVIALQMAETLAARFPAAATGLGQGVGATTPWLAAFVVLAGAAGLAVVLATLAIEERGVASAGGALPARAFAGELRRGQSGERHGGSPGEGFPLTGLRPQLETAGQPALPTPAAPMDPIVIFRTDPTGPDVLSSLSRNAAELWGYPDGALDVPAAADLFHADDWNDERTANWRMRFAAGASRVTEDVRVRRGDGVYRWHQLSLAPIEGQGNWMGHLVDVDARKHAELHAHAQVCRMAEMADAQRDVSRGAMVIEDIREMLHLADTLAESRDIIRRACGRLLPGWSGALMDIDADGRPVVAARWGEALPMIEHFGQRDCWALRSQRVHRYANPREHALCTHLMPDAAGAVRPHFCLPIVDHRESIGSLHMFAPHAFPSGEIDALRSRMEALAKMLGQALSNLRLRLALREHAMRDALTGLYQRRFLEQSLPAELQRAHRDRRAVSLAIIDVDHMSSFNDRYGRPAGDAILSAIGQVLSATLRGYDTACRVGGEEVALMLPGCELEDALIRLEEIRCVVEGLQLEHAGVQLPVATVSVGIAEARGGAADALMLRASHALQRAKHNGRNRIELADREGPVLA